MSLMTKTQFLNYIITGLIPEDWEHAWVGLEADGTVMAFSGKPLFAGNCWECAGNECLEIDKVDRSVCNLDLRSTLQQVW